MSTQNDAPPKLLAPIPTSIVCKTCHEETGLTPENIIETVIDTHICCPICGAMIYSCLPEKPAPYVYTGQSSSVHTYDYD